MVSARLKNAIRNLGTGIVYRIIYTLMPFIVRTVIINTLGREYLGLNTLFTSIFTFLNLAEFGFANAITYRMYKPAKEKDYKILSVYASALKKIYRAVGFLILLLGICVMPFLKFFVSGSCPSDINIYVLFLIYLINTIIPYLGHGYCLSIFTAFQRVDWSNKINSLIIFLMNLSQIALLYIIKDYYCYIICLPIFSLFNNYLLFRIKKKNYGNIKVNEKIDKKLLSDMFSTTGALFGHRLNYVIVHSSDNIIISSFLGLGVLAIYGNYYSILATVVSLIEIIVNACLPGIGNLLTDGDDERSLKIFKVFNFLIYWVTGWCSICMLCLYQPFMLLWMGSDMLLPVSSVFLFSIHTFVYKSFSSVSMFRDALGIWKADWIRPYISAGINIIFNIVLIKKIGVNGVIISTIFSLFVINGLWSSYVLLRIEFQGYIKRFYIDYFVAVLKIITAGIPTYVLCNSISIGNTYILIILKGIICIVLPNLILLSLNYKKMEYRYIIDRIKVLFKKREKNCL